MMTNSLLVIAGVIELLLRFTLLLTLGVLTFGVLVLALAADGDIDISELLRPYAWELIRR